MVVVFVLKTPIASTPSKTFILQTLTTLPSLTRLEYTLYVTLFDNISYLRQVYCFGRVL